MKKVLGPFPVGIWVALFAIILHFLAWGMQAYSLLNWDQAVNFGFQNERFTGNAVEQAWALESWGVAMADMIWALPIGVIAVFGIPKKKYYGYSAGLMELAIGVYWPVVFTFQRWDLYRETAILALIVWVPISVLGIWGLWRNQKFFIHTNNQ